MNAEKDSEEIRRLEARRRAAMLAADRDALAELVSPDLEYTHTNGNTETRDEFLAKVGKGATFSQYDAVQETVSLYGDIAIVSGEMAVGAKIADGGPDLSLRTKMLGVWAKEGGRWRQIRFQVTKIDPKYWEK
ncbi:MAG: nuclear transport factor 2 family protein [Hyphomonadaceae bacterium]